MIEPRLHLFFTSYQRPSLPVVMLATAAVSAAGALLLGTVFRTAAQLGAASGAAVVAPPACAVAA